MNYFFIGILFFLSTSILGQEKTKFIQKDGVFVSSTTSNCSMSMGYDTQRKILKFENTNNHPVILTWDLHLWFDGTCKTCNDPNGEYSFTLQLDANETISGSCDLNAESKLQFFSKFIDEDTDISTVLTKFELHNFSVVKDE